MARLVVVSNRVGLPRQRATQAGGLAVAVREALRRREGLWFGWSGELAEATSETPKLTGTGRVGYATIDLSAADHAAYYTGFANSTLWPLLHYRLGLLAFRRDDFAGYLRVNSAFARALAGLLRPDDLVWVHDYQLMTLGVELRRLGLRNRIGFFLHTPLPASAVLEALPRHEELMSALASYDLVGFQTRSDLTAFRDYASNVAGGGHAEDGTVHLFGQSTRAGVFPVSIDTQDFTALAEKAAGSEETQRLRESLGGRRLVIGVDRLDYSKGLPNRFAAFGHLLSARPEHRQKLTLLQIAPRSRTDVAQYRTLRRELEQAAGRINGKFAEFDWMPIRYLNRNTPRRTLAGFYRLSQIGLVTPLRDGMNLVAKEYVAAQPEQDPGVLVLSRFAGAARELDGALIINPFDVEAIADALHLALVMPLDERQARWAGMIERLRRHTVRKWCDDFLTALAGNGPRSGGDPPA